MTSVPVTHGRQKCFHKGVAASLSMCVNTLLSPPHGACYFVYYETIKRKLDRRLIYECRCDERLKAKAEGSTRLAYTVLRGGLEHLKIKTRLIDERFASVMGEYIILTVPVVPTWLCGSPSP